MVDFSDFRHQIGSQIGHFGVQNGPFWGSQQLQGASEHPFGGRLPSEYAHLGHLGPFGHMGRKWGILPLFSPFRPDGSKYDCTTIKRSWSKLVIYDTHMIHMMHITQYGGLDPSRDMVQGPQIWGARGPDMGPPPRGHICLYEAVWTL